MKRYPRFLMLLVMPLLTLNCANEKDNAITIGISDKAATRILVGQYERIDLETTETSLVYSINEIIPFHDGYIVPGRENAMLFSGDGTFLSRIGGKGRGPGEYLSLSSCYVYHDTVMIYSSTGKSISKYVFDDNDSVFTPAGKISLPDSLTIHKLKQTDMYPDRYFALNTYHGIGNVTPSLSIFDEDFNRLVSSEIRIKMGGNAWTAPFGITDDGVFFTDFANYSIIELTSDRIDESRRLDFGENSYPDQYLHYDDPIATFNFMMNDDQMNLSLPTRIESDNGCLYIGLFKGRMARYDMESEESQVVRFMLDDSTPLEYTTFHIHNGYILLGGEFSQDNITNPPVYKIPLNVFLLNNTSQK